MIYFDNFYFVNFGVDFSAEMCDYLDHWFLLAVKAQNCTTREFEKHAKIQSQIRELEWGHVTDCRQKSLFRIHMSKIVWFRNVMGFFRLLFLIGEQQCAARRLSCRRAVWALLLNMQFYARSTLNFWKLLRTTFYFWIWIEN